MTLIGVRIGPFRRAQQREPQHISLGIVSVFAIIQQTESMCSVGNVSPAIRWNLELCLLGRCVTGCWTFHGTKRNLVRRLVAVRANRKCNFQKYVLLMPVGLHLDV